jgi:hypothetical protein
MEMGLRHVQLTTGAESKMRRFVDGYGINKKSAKLIVLVGLFYSAGATYLFIALPWPLVTNEVFVLLNPLEATVSIFRTFDRFSA